MSSVYLMFNQGVEQNVSQSGVSIVDLSPKAGYPKDVTMMGTLEKSLKYDMSVSNKQVFT